jgi:hypothetical protein
MITYKRISNSWSQLNCSFFCVEKINWKSKKTGSSVPWIQHNSCSRTWSCNADLRPIKEYRRCINRTQYALNNFWISIVCGGMALLTKLRAGPETGWRGRVGLARKRGDERLIHVGWCIAASISSSQFHRHSGYKNWKLTNFRSFRLFRTIDHSQSWPRIKLKFLISDHISFIVAK